MERDPPLIMELKVIETILGIHKTQLLSYMKLEGIGTGALMIFSVELLAAGHSQFLGYDGLPVRRQSLAATDWKSVVQVQLNANFQL